MTLAAKTPPCFGDWPRSAPGYACTACDALSACDATARSIHDKPAAQDPLKTQVGGDHYRSMKIQPIEYITANELDFLAGNVVKYISRHKAKGGKADVEKAMHYCQLILKLQYGDEKRAEDIATLKSMAKSPTFGKYIDASKIPRE